MAPSREELLAELDALRVENARLRSQALEDADSMRMAAAKVSEALSLLRKVGRPGDQHITSAEVPEVVPAEGTL